VVIGSQVNHARLLSLDIFSIGAVERSKVSHESKPNSNLLLNILGIHIPNTSDQDIDEK